MLAYPAAGFLAGFSLILYIPRVTLLSRETFMHRILFVLIAAGLMLAGCGKQEDSNTVVIGQYAALSGEIANFGKFTDLGVQLAVAERNERGGIKGRKIVLQTYDDRGQQADAKSAVTRLITQDKAVAVIGQVASSLSMVGGQVAQEYGVPMVTPSSTNPQVTEVGDMVFRVCYTDTLQGLYCARFAAEKGWKTAAVLYDRKQAYSVGLKDSFAEHFTRAGGTIVTEQAYGSGDTDFSAQLNAIKNAKPDVIFLPGYYNDIGNIAIQAKNQNLNLPFLGGDGWTDTEKVAPPDAIDNCFFVNHCALDSPDPQNAAFVEKFKQRFPDDEPNVWTALGYDAAVVLFDAMERAESFSGKDIAAALAQTKDHKGISGTISIDENRNAVKPAVIQTYRDGKPVYVTTINP
jgi:branched-chain amino acid transport system substrate-binding protein